MLLTKDDVAFPQALLNSLDEERLVVFVGAGVSAKAYAKQPKGSWYPDFKGLVKAVGDRLGKPTTSFEKKLVDDGFVDRVLGDWEDTDGTVRHLVSDILQENQSFQRLNLHKAIVRLFKGKTSPRIVTTNFDRLLVRAVAEEGLQGQPEWRVTLAPSLPPLRRFKGICHLHGGVDDPIDIVLTDRDIGRAYMDEGWALRFAHAMFQQFDVLFVGYSLEDPPLRYLSLALQGATTRSRWALVGEPRRADRKREVERSWFRRNVTPIWFPVVRKDYRACERAIGVWAEDAARSFLDRRNVLAALSRDPPSTLKPHDISRAAFFLKDAASLRDFSSLQLNVEWLEKLLEWGFLDFLIRGIGQATEADFNVTQRLVDWIFDNPVVTLGTLSPYRRSLNSLVLIQVARRIDGDKPKKIEIHLISEVSQRWCSWAF